MLGFVPVPKPVCEAEFEDLDGVSYACHRAAPYWTAWHIHRNTQNWWIGWTFIDLIFYFPLKAQRQADLFVLTETRRQLDRNTIPEDHDDLNDAVAEAEKRVLFGRWRGWKYEART